MNVRLVHTSASKAQSHSGDSGQRQNLIRRLRGLLRETCQMRNEGVAYAKLAHAQGYADGYMKVLTDAGYVTQRELLDIILEVRRGVDGPATAIVEAPEALMA